MQLSRYVVSRRVKQLLLHGAGSATTEELTPDVRRAGCTPALAANEPIRRAVRSTTDVAGSCLRRVGPPALRPRDCLRRGAPPGPDIRGLAGRGMRNGLPSTSFGAERLSTATMTATAPYDRRPDRLPTPGL